MEKVFIKIWNNGIGFLAGDDSPVKPGSQLRKKLSDSAGKVVGVDKKVLRYLAPQCFKIVPEPVKVKEPLKVGPVKTGSEPKHEKKINKPEQKPSTPAIPAIQPTSKGD
jgi:hypothetical protein